MQSLPASDKPWAHLLHVPSVLSHVDLQVAQNVVGFHPFLHLQPFNSVTQVPRAVHTSGIPPHALQDVAWSLGAILPGLQPVQAAAPGASENWPTKQA